MLMTGQHEQVFSHSLQGMSYTFLVEYPDVVKSKVSGALGVVGDVGAYSLPHQIRGERGRRE